MSRGQEALVKTRQMNLPTESALPDGKGAREGHGKRTRPSAKRDCAMRGKQSGHVGCSEASQVRRANLDMRKRGAELERLTGTGYAFKFLHASLSGATRAEVDRKF